MVFPILMALIAQLPAPTGSHPVGTTTFSVTDARRGSRADGGDSPRVIMVHAWYPATAGGATRAPYLRDEPAMAELRKLNPGLAGRFLVEGVTTHATLDTPVASVAGGLPVVIFSHGYLALPSDYTALMEDLASHGYAVFSVTHPYETTATSIGGGRVTLGFGTRGLNEVTGAVIKEWHDEDSVSTAVTSASDPATAERTMREFLGRIPKSAEALERWAEDMRVTVDWVTALGEKGSGDRFAGKLDLAKLGAFGHSMGGITSAAYCARDPRCRAAINLDGSPQYGDLIDKPGKSPFLMVYATRPGRVGVSDLIYGRSDSAWRAVIEGTLHLNFGDFQYRDGVQRLDASLGAISAERATTIVHRLVREWFDQWLGGKKSPLLGGSNEFAELKVSRIAHSP
jgi:predicted dienelactone hydrolase